jgi:orotate phosphoribosyltransferase
MGTTEFSPKSPEALKKIVLEANVIETGHFIFANGNHALVKVEMDRLWEHPNALAIILEHLAQAQGLPPADVVLGVPTGGMRIAEKLSETYLNGLPLSRLERIPDGTKQDFRFCSDYDREVALSANSPRIYEDVVTSFSSVAGVVRLLNPREQDIHSLAIWRRGRVNDTFRSGVTDHYLIEEVIADFAPDECPRKNLH